MITATEGTGETHHAGALRYLVCWLALALLTGLTFALSTVALGGWSTPIALAIAVTKAAVVALFFMHLWDHPGANRLVFVVSILFVALLMSFTMLDVTTRFPLALPAY
jgi:cytochrome c oxidase subunit IV